MEIAVNLPLDSDGFLRRECPTCEQEFKWFHHGEHSTDAEIVDQYFCPLCGQPSGSDTWWTPQQVEFMHASAGPALDEAIKDAFSGLGNSKYVDVKPNRNFSLGIETPEPLTEPDDMVIVESPCHSNEPVKIPEHAQPPLHCLICGSAFAV